MKNSVNLADLVLISPFIALFLSSLIPIFIKVMRGNREQPLFATLTQGLLGLVLSAGLLVVFGRSGQSAFNGTLVMDGVSVWMGAIALVSTGVALIFMYESPSINKKQFSEVVFLTLSSALGMLLLVSSVDLLMIFVGLEMMSLPLYLMIPMSMEGKLSKESAVKYFILGSFASALFLYGVSMIFGSTGSTHIFTFMEKAPELVGNHPLFLVGFTLVLIGFCFKVSIAPFHAWTPDVYQGAPTPLTAMMATAIKVVSFAALLRLIATKALIGLDPLFDFMQWLAVITMIVGNTAAILQNNLKRMLAYSSIGHSGYLLVGVISTGISSEGSFAASSVIFYLFSYSIMSLGAFALIHLLEKHENSSLMLQDLSGFAKKSPLLAFSLTVALLSMAGIPPALGFWGKFYLFTAAIGDGLLWLALWGVLSSVMGVYYYLRPIVLMYMGESVETFEGRLSLERDRSLSSLIAYVTAVLILILGIFSGSLFDLIEKSLL